MIKLICTRLRSFVSSDDTTNKASNTDTAPTAKPNVDIGQRAERILDSRKQQSADTNFDVGCWR